jgi:hypothetical protein
MPRKLTEERQRAKDEQQIFIDCTIDFDYLSDEWKQKGLFGRIQIRGPFPPELNEDLMRVWLLLLNRTPLDDPSHYLTPDVDVYSLSLLNRTPLDDPSHKKKKKKTKKKARKKPKKVR